MAGECKPNELRITRIYDAPAQAVWDAWTDPAQVAQWWGPRGFTITTHSKDLKPGGTWRYTMHGPDGTDYLNVTRYFEVENFRRLVYDHGGSDDRPALFRVTVHFSETDGKTRMEMTMTLPTPEAAAETRKFIKKAGGDATWDRLAEFLGRELSGKERFVINRSFESPIGRMFEMWTDPEHVARWVAPAGFEMSDHGGHALYGRTEYLEIRRPDRIVYSGHPSMPNWPETILATVTLAEEGPGRTRVTLLWEPYGKVSAEALGTFIQARSRMTQDWTGSFDKLEDYLA